MFYRGAEQRPLRLMDTQRMPEEKRILIVDDDPDVHDLLRVALRDTGRTFESARDGIEGLKRIAAEPWDLVITDVLMPGMDGMALLERIRSLRPEARVVVMTVATTAANVAEAIRKNAFAWFSKPFTIDAVRDMVNHALNDEPADDDIEVISASPHWLGLRVRCRMNTAARILQFIGEMELRLPPREKENVAAAFREILLNAIEHGAGNDPDKKVRIQFVRAKHALLYYVQDPGKGFSFEDLSHAASSNQSPEEHSSVRAGKGMRAGGFGILITRALVDELIYNDAGNEVLLIKYLPTT
jgi:CheY-like chemotaxis protein/anti-sigma regulatory factor (Ser/Thr protein kinase)